MSETGSPRFDPAGDLGGGRTGGPVVVYYSQDVRCSGCGTWLRVIGDGHDGLSAKTLFFVSCPNCQRAISCEALRPIVPREVEVIWYKEQ